jgi:nucleosome binding factor SPN SPT16 subunit
LPDLRCLLPALCLSPALQLTYTHPHPSFFCCSTTYEPAQKFPQLIFLKELSFRTSDAKHAARLVQEIKVLRSTVLQRDKELAERATLVKQEKLVRGKVRVMRCYVTQHSVKTRIWQNTPRC